jgi:putative endonuclease
VARDYNFYVYIVRNEHDSVLYIGMTSDLARRISEHRAGERFQVSPRITAVRNWSITSTAQMCWMRSHGKKQLKKWSRAKKVALIATLNPRWKDLAPEILGE